MDIPLEIKQVMDQFHKAGFQIYLVGGAVRDLLLIRPHTDWDLTTDATPEQVMELFPSGFSNNQFGTVGVDTKQGVVQITTMRKEGKYLDARHPSEVSWTKNLEEDLARRDFTINAMALDQNIIDPFNGRVDLEKKIIRAVGDADKRFSEDALRLIRAIRFASQLGFTIEEKTWQAIIKNKDLLKMISWERIRDELLKIVVVDFAEEGIRMLKSSGLLEVVLPEVIPSFGIEQAGEKHDRTYDIGEHLILTMKHIPSADPIVKLAGLLHDVGKPKTLKIKDGNTTFYHHEHVGAVIVKEIAQRLRLSKKDSDKLFKLVRFHMFPVDERQTDSALRRFIKNVGVENIDDMLALREGDRIGGGTANATSWRLEQFKGRIQKLLISPFTVKDLKVNGKDVMETLKISPSRKVGEILNKLFAEILKENNKNNRRYLLRRIQDLV